LLTFKCLRCGSCCKNLVVASTFETSKGLVIFPEERPLFPEGLVFPFHGVGNFPEGRYFRIVTYQVSARTCPHLKFNKLSMCNIYERRPLACKSFPFFYLGSPFTISGTCLALKGNCSFVKKYKIESPSRIKALNEKKAAEQILSKMSIREGTQWYFGLKEKEWIPLGTI
jgi:Fe-S-cluster containining protein